MSKVYLLYPKVIKGEEADRYFQRTKKDLGHNIDLAPKFDGIKPNTKTVTYGMEVLED